MGEEEQQQSEAQIGEGRVGTTSPSLPAISAAQFLSWKLRKDTEAAMKKEEQAHKRKEDIASGKVQMNGRELFLHEPWVFDNELY